MAASTVNGQRATKKTGTKKAGKRMPAKKSVKKASVATRRNGAMSAEHKAALAEGRNLSRRVKTYLEALESNRPRRGRQVTTADLERRLARIEKEIPAANVIQRLTLLQDKADIEARLDQAEEPVDMTALEKDFVKVAKAYSEAKGITYATWRTMGVHPIVLQKAGVARTRR